MTQHEESQILESFIKSDSLNNARNISRCCLCLMSKGVKACDMQIALNRNVQNNFPFHDNAGVLWVDNTKKMR